MHPNEQPFLDEIRANPNDDAARQVYADWLEERGDVRGEYLRLECQLSNSLHYNDEIHEVTITMRRLIEGIDRKWIEFVTRRLRENCPVPAECPTLTGPNWITDCEQCNRQIAHCDTLSSARFCAERGDVVVVSPSIVRKENDLYNWRPAIVNGKLELVDRE